MFKRTLANVGSVDTLIDVAVVSAVFVYKSYQSPTRLAGHTGVAFILPVNTKFRDIAGELMNREHLYDQEAIEEYLAANGYEGDMPDVEHVSSDLQLPKGTPPHASSMPCDACYATYELVMYAANKFQWHIVIVQLAPAELAVAVGAWSCTHAPTGHGHTHSTTWLRKHESQTL